MGFIPKLNKEDSYNESSVICYISDQLRGAKWKTSFLVVILRYHPFPAASGNVSTRRFLFGKSQLQSVCVDFPYELSAAAAEEDAAALLQGVIPEIVEQAFEIHAWKNVDAADGAVGDIARETVDIPTPGILVINPGKAPKKLQAQGTVRKLEHLVPEKYVG